MADEIFLTGTAEEVTSIREVDFRTIREGKRGPITEELQTAFFDIVTGKDARYDHWRAFLWREDLEPVDTVERGDPIGLRERRVSCFPS